MRGPSNSEISFLGHLFKTSINHCQSLNLLSKSDSPKKFHERKYIIFSFAEHFQYLYNVTSSSPENPEILIFCKISAYQSKISAYQSHSYGHQSGKKINRWNWKLLRQSSACWDCTSAQLHVLSSKEGNNFSQLL